MSEEALLFGTRDYLRRALSLTDEQCGVQIEGRPPAVFGDVFVGVAPAEWRSDGLQEQILDETFGIEVHCLRRASVAPRSKQADKIVYGTLGSLNSLIRQVMLAIHMNYELLNVVNAEITGTQPKFFQPLRWRSTDRPQIRDGSQWNAQPDQLAGLARTVHFGGAQRYQTMGSSTA